jgi:hypothetical protein
MDVFGNAIELQRYLRGPNPNSGLQRIPGLIDQHFARKNALGDQAWRDQVAKDTQELRHRHDKELVELRHKNAIELQKIENEAALERSQAQVQGYLDRSSAQEKDRLKRDLIVKMKIMPKAGESDDDFILRANEEQTKREQDETNRAAQVLEGWDKDHQKIEASITDLLEKEEKRQGTVAEEYARKQFGESMDVEPKERAAISALVAKGLSLDAAIQQYGKKNPGRAAELKSLLDGFRLEGSAYAQQTTPKTTSRTLDQLEQQKKALQYRQNMFLTTPEGQRGNSQRFMAPGAAATPNAIDGGYNEEVGRRTQEQASSNPFSDFEAAAGVKPSAAVVPGAAVTTPPTAAAAPRRPDWMPSAPNAGVVDRLNPQATIPNGSALSLPPMRQPAQADPVARPLNLQPMRQESPQERVMSLRQKLRDTLDFSYQSRLALEGPEAAKQGAMMDMANSPEAAELAKLNQVLSMPTVNPGVAPAPVARAVPQRPNELRFMAPALDETPPALMALP